MINVFPLGTSDYSTNGLMDISKYATVAQISEELNGEYELELQLIHDARLNAITNDMVIRAPAPVRETPEIMLYTPPVLGNKIFTVCKSSAYLRVGAGSSYKARGRYKRGTTAVLVSGEGTSWYRVTIMDGSIGYMRASDLSYVRTEYISPAKSEVIKPRQTRDQLFRIYDISPTLEGMAIKAKHVFFDIAGNFIRTATGLTQSVSGTVAAQRIFDSTLFPHKFTIHADVNTVGYFDIARKNPLEAIVGDGGLISNFGGEIFRDNFEVYYVAAIGYDRGVTLAYRKNITGMEIKTDISGVVTKIIPIGFAKDGTLIYLDDVYVSSERVSSYDTEVPRVVEREYRDIKVGNGYADAAAVKTAIRTRALEEFASGADMPEVSATIEYVDLKKALAPEDFAAYTDVFLGDTVRIRHEDYGFNISIKCISYCWDCLLGEYISLELGTRKASLSNLRIDASLIKDAALSGRKLGVGAVSGENIGSGAVGESGIADGAINSGKIANAAVNSDKIANAAVSGVKIALLAINEAHIADAAVTAAKIAEAAIGTAHITDAAISRAKIAEAAIGTAQIGDAAISSAKITDAAIGTAQIADASILTAKIALGAITQALIAEGAIGTAQIADASITDAKIVELSANRITTGTLAVERLIIVGANRSIVYTINEANGTAQLSHSTIDGGALTQRSITADRIVAGAITADEIAAATILANHIAAGAITADKIASNAIEVSHISAFAQSALTLSAYNYVNGNGLHTSHISIDGDTIEIYSLGKVLIDAGASFDLTAGSAQGEYLGIHNRPSDNTPYALFAGADDGNGTNARFRVNHSGEAWLNDAHIAGTLEVSHDEGSDKRDIIFNDGTTFDIKGVSGDNFLNAITLNRLRRFTQTHVGTVVPSEAISSPVWGERYLRLCASHPYDPYTYAPTLTGYKRTVAQPQKRIVKTYSYIWSVAGMGAPPTKSNTDTGFYNTGAATYGVPEVHTTTDCYTSASSASSPTSARSSSSATVTANGWIGTETCVTVTYYRTRSSDKYYVVSSAEIPTSGATGVLDGLRYIDSAILSVIRSIVTSCDYSLYSSSTADGEGDRRLIGQITSTTATLSWFIAGAVSDLDEGSRFISIESDSSSGACSLTAADIFVTYTASYPERAEYVFDGSEWICISYSGNWEDLTLTNCEAWDDGRAPKIRRFGDLIEISGAIRLSAKLAAGETLSLGLAIPIKYSPKQSTFVALPIITDAGAIRLNVWPTGEITIRNVNSTSVPTTRFISLACNYIL